MDTGIPKGRRKKKAKGIQHGNLGHHQLMPVMRKRFLLFVTFPLHPLHSSQDRVMTFFYDTLSSSLYFCILA